MTDTPDPLREALTAKRKLAALEASTTGTLLRAVRALVESPTPDARDKLGEDVVTLLDRLAQQGGTIVCTSALTEAQITIARAAGRLAVDADGIGYVWVPGPKYPPAEGSGSDELWCPQCGPVRRIDEDGCCAVCGATTGEIATAIAARDKRIVELESRIAANAAVADETIRRERAAWDTEVRELRRELADERTVHDDDTVRLGRELGRVRGDMAEKLAHERIEKRTLESRLAAMQAVVDAARAIVDLGDYRFDNRKACAMSIGTLCSFLERNDYANTACALSLTTSALRDALAALPAADAEASDSDPSGLYHDRVHTDLGVTREAKATRAADAEATGSGDTVCKSCGDAPCNGCQLCGGVSHDCPHRRIAREVADPAIPPTPASDGARGGFYLASKAKHGPRWRTLRANGHAINSTWIDECGAGETLDYGEFWERVIREVTAAKALVIYHENGETMKGALVELGAALAAGVPVMWVNADSTYTAMHHPNVRTCNTLDYALTWAGLMCKNDSSGASAKPSVSDSAEAATGTAGRTATGEDGGGSVLAVAFDVLECARSWDPDVCLLGNVTARDVGRLAEHVVESTRGAEPVAPAGDSDDSKGGDANALAEGRSGRRGDQVTAARTAHPQAAGKCGKSHKVPGLRFTWVCDKRYGHRGLCGRVAEDYRCQRCECLIQDCACPSTAGDSVTRAEVEAACRAAERATLVAMHGAARDLGHDESAELIRRTLERLAAATAGGKD